MIVACMIYMDPKNDFLRKLLFKPSDKKDCGLCGFSLTFFTDTERPIFTADPDLESQLLPLK